MTLPGKTPDEPGNRQADGPKVLPERAKEEDMRELQDPYDLPFPDDSDRRPSGRPEYAIVVDQLRGWQPSGPPLLVELLETGPPANPSPTWKPNHNPTRKALPWA